MSIPASEKVPFTEKQGQYLAFIKMYIKVNKIPPAHTDFQEYFDVTPPTVNQMIKTLENKGLIRKKPKTPRNISVLAPDELIPALK
ncbi:MarR family transcriptional regulator [Parashewanella spongiae]|uniref:MarR family transcriptional regulator n=1 Tax=Parashewanella spongiae TaxID=342950 RepID=A0A3A6TVE1_9GAMM|nr:MarR family transcriptional regulator [Parashewanella spongiae]MCL1078665.1 helix-turn-helix domain-containing protein [Parashewanella spongiae]RJY12961.1 MarR family transcriptional regulator [Parashewanella spongiae]